MQQPKLFGEKCPWCEGDGRVGLAQRGAGPRGLDCPYCYEYRAVYVIGQVPKHATTLPPERSQGLRWWQHFEQQMAASTAENTPLRDLYPRRVAAKPISRPRRRTEPMPSHRGGVVRHWTTGEMFKKGTWTRIFAPGPTTRQHQYNMQKVFVESYEALKDQRERIKFRITIIAWLCVCVGSLALVIFVIIAMLNGFMTP